MNKVKGLRITGVIIVCLALILFAAAAASPPPSTSVFSSPKDITLSPAEAAVFDIYEVDFSRLPGAGSNRRISIADQILNLCKFAEAIEIGDILISTYTPVTLAEYLYNCDEITEVAITDSGYLNIMYSTINGKLVGLGYMGDRLSDKIVYDEATDIAFIDYLNLNGTQFLQTRFREGNSYQVSPDELLSNFSDIFPSSHI